MQASVRILQVGVGGSGRQSLCRLATFMAGFSLATIEASNSFGIDEWRDNLRAVLRKVGTTGEAGVLLIADTQLK